MVYFTKLRVMMRVEGTNIEDNVSPLPEHKLIYGLVQGLLI